MSDYKDIAEQLLDLYNFSDEMNQYDQIYIYGAGMVGQFIYEYLKKKSMKQKVCCFFTSKPQDLDIFEIPVKVINKTDIISNSVVLLAAKRGLRKEMMSVCNDLDISNLKEIDVMDDRDYEYYSSMPEAGYLIELKNWIKMGAGRELNIENPKTFNEKINWSKLYDRDPRKTRLADKYLVREYVKEKIGEEYLIPFLGVWERFDDIDFDKLPDRFVLKCNHGCGWNIIVKDKSLFNKNEAQRNMESWLKTNYAFVYGFEMQYKNIQPMIIGEQMLNLDKNNDIPDYKFFCFDGKVFCCYVMKDYYEDHSTGKLGFFDRYFEQIPYYRDMYRPLEKASVKKPQNYEKMVEIAERLSEGFSHVRIDLYNISGKIYFGEMTFTTSSGIGFFEPDKFDLVLGNLWKI